MWRYVVGVVIFLFLIIFGVKLFQAATKSSAPKKTDTTKTTSLPDYASTTAQVRFTQDGPINSNIAHRTIQITVGRDQSNLNIIQGYEGNSLRTNNFDNNQSAYEVFLNALNNSGFMREKKVSNKNIQETGQCPLGFRYTYQLMNTGNSDEDKTLWSTSCNTGLGNFGGNFSTIIVLFQRQIPEYTKLTQDVIF